MLKYRNAICIFGKYMQNNLPLMSSPINYPSDNTQQVRHIKKHWNQKFCKERRDKVMKLEIPEYYRVDKIPEKYQLEFKKKTLHLYERWAERDIFISCTNTIIEPYIVPEGDGKLSSTTKKGAKQKIDFIRKKGTSHFAVKKIKSYDENFSVKLFPMESLDIYKNAHETLAAKDHDKLLQYVTETAYPQMIYNTIDKTIHWKFLESLEPPRIVHACHSAADKVKNADVFGQVTVRFHTQQILCIYDRFGRILQGSEILRKDVLDYVVFEKHLSSMYGTWRVHAKIVPNWMSPGEIAAKTYILPKDDSSTEESNKESDIETVLPEKLEEPKVKETPTQTI